MAIECALSDFIRYDDNILQSYISTGPCIETLKIVFIIHCRPKVTIKNILNF